MVKSSPIRILQVFGIMNMGGAEAFIMNIYRNIDRSKIQFDFIVHSRTKGHYDDEIRSLGGRIYYVPKFNILNILKYTREWKKFFRENPNYKVVHSHIRSSASIFFPIAKKNGLKTIIHSHSISSGSGAAGVIKDVMQYPIKYIADYFFACSKAAGEWLFGKKKLSEKNFFLIKNSIDVDSFKFNSIIRNDIRKQLKIEDKFIIGHVGRFEYPKNHVFLIDIFKEIHSREESAVLLLIGYGSLENQIKQKVKDLGLEEHVYFLGKRTDIYNLLNSFDVFLFPSHYEGFPVTLIEAQASGLKVIASDTIPKEIKITDLVEFVSLKEPVEVWGQKVLNNKNSHNRYSYYKNIINEGFDIRSNTKWVEEFYCSINK